VTDQDRPESPDELYRALLEREARLEALVERLLGREKGEKGRSAPACDPGDAPAMDGGASVHLTEREGQVLQLLVVGHTNREIGNRLLLEAGTVRNYLGRIFRKLSVTTRTQAAVRALELGLVESNAGRPFTGTTREGKKDAEGRR
jgi:DNA-binding NarL/FixJ family response regulator